MEVLHPRSCPGLLISRLTRAYYNMYAMNHQKGVHPQALEIIARYVVVAKLDITLDSSLHDYVM